MANVAEAAVLASNARFRGCANLLTFADLLAARRQPSTFYQAPVDYPIPPPKFGRLSYKILFI